MPTCLVHHGHEGCLEDRLALLCCLHVKVQAILGRASTSKNSGGNMVSMWIFWKGSRVGERGTSGTSPERRR